VKKIVAVLVTSLLAPWLVAQAALTDIAQSPLATAPTASVKPNFMFTLDDSGSMGFSHMPDDVDNWYTKVGYKNYLCNAMYYNPNVTYKLPWNQASALDFPAATFSGAKYNGYIGTTTVDLRTAFKAYDSNTTNNTANDTAQAAYYYKFSGAGTPTSAQCAQTASTFSPFNSTDFTKTIVSTSSGPGATNELQNFANWYSYYRTRMQSMKSAAGLAFKNIDDNYRVGFVTIHETSSTGNYLPIDAFTTTQKNSWYSKLYSISPNSGTPLREALSRVGWIYAGKKPFGDDPVQYSCQKNFALLTTDGFWNGNAGYDLNGNAVGNQDGDISVTPRPQYDGSVSRVTTKNVTITETDSYTFNGCSGVKKRLATKTDTSTQTIVQDGGTVTSDTTTTTSSTTNTSCQTNPGALRSPNPTVTTTTSSTASNIGGSSNSLADVAEYYYKTDLRTTALANCVGALGGAGPDVCANNVDTSSSDPAIWQHMGTFTLGLGVNGALNYQSNYDATTTPAGDFLDVKNGVKTWPTPVADDLTAVDDLWHAAVDGHGKYFSARTPEALVNGLVAVLNSVSAKTGAAAAAATSNPNVVTGDSFRFSTSYKTAAWTGEVIRETMDVNTGATVSATPDWSAQAQLDALTSASSDSRTIYTFSASASSGLKTFTWGNLTAAEQAYFSPTLLSQYASLNAAQQANATGQNLVNYLRGQRAYEINPSATTTAEIAASILRQREHVLGDIVAAEAVYDKVPRHKYQDTNYATFKSNVTAANPSGMVYVASNDGMVHAFRADTGVERWAYIPSMALSNLYRLADQNYAVQHRFLVDATPQIDYICPTAPTATCAANEWRTILVGGLGAGGRGFYALDVTDPASPKALWEFKPRSTSCAATTTAAVGDTTDCDLGLSYTQPVITKLGFGLDAAGDADKGRWVVLVASGYNNTSPGDGKGYIYALNPMTGAILKKMGTGVGDTSSPSGLAKISGWADNTSYNNTTLRVYGGDLLGNLWRFDPDGMINASTTVVQLAVTGNSTGAVMQPITQKPELGLVDSFPVVYFGTGKYLGSSDVSDNSQQSFYAIKDKLTTTGDGKIRDDTNMVQQSSTVFTNAQGETARKNALPVGMNFITKDGWYIDWPNSGERTTTDPTLDLGTFSLTTIIPGSDACAAGGTSWQYFVDYKTGGPVETSADKTVAIYLGNVVATRPIVIRLANGKVVSVIRTSKGDTLIREIPIAGAGAGGRRISWRELVEE
jgi:type IV pilus assembly protein PilY1